jgi:hypothetical protein
MRAPSLQISDSAKPGIASAFASTRRTSSETGEHHMTRHSKLASLVALLCLAFIGCGTGLDEGTLDISDSDGTDALASEAQGLGYTKASTYCNDGKLVCEIRPALVSAGYKYRKETYSCNKGKQFYYNSQYWRACW